MGKIAGQLRFTGSLGDISAYQTQSSEDIIVRSKGGPSREQVKYSDAFALCRKNNAEFSDVNQITEIIKNGIAPVKHLNDYNYTPALNGIGRSLQQMDSTNAWGQRGTLFSLYGHLLEGFDLNRNILFSHVVKPSLDCTIDRAAGAAMITIPSLAPGINLFIPWTQSLFRFVISMGVLDDRTWTDKGYTMVSTLPPIDTAATYSDWQVYGKPIPAQTFSLALQHPEWLDENRSIILSIGIETGIPLTQHLIKTGKQKGCARILKVE